MSIDKRHWIKGDRMDASAPFGDQDEDRHCYRPPRRRGSGILIFLHSENWIFLWKSTKHKKNGNWFLKFFCCTTFVEIIDFSCRLLTGRTWSRVMPTRTPSGLFLRLTASSVAASPPPVSSPSRLVFSLMALASAEAPSSPALLSWPLLTAAMGNFYYLSYF